MTSDQYLFLLLLATGYWLLTTVFPSDQPPFDAVISGEWRVTSENNSPLSTPLGFFAVALAFTGHWLLPLPLLLLATGYWLLTTGHCFSHWRLLLYLPAPANRLAPAFLADPHVQQAYV